jgi:hypothetical protein
MDDLANLLPRRGNQVGHAEPGRSLAGAFEHAHAPESVFGD